MEGVYHFANIPEIKEDFRPNHNFIYAQEVQQKVTPLTCVLSGKDTTI